MEVVEVEEMIGIEKIVHVQRIVHAYCGVLYCGNQKQLIMQCLVCLTLGIYLDFRTGIVLLGPWPVPFFPLRV